MALAKATLALPIRVLETGVSLAGTGIETAGAGLEAVAPEAVRRLRDDLVTLADLRTERTQRRVAVGTDRAAVEVRGLTSPEAGRVLAALEERLEQTDAVQWWRVNAVTGRVVAGLSDIEAELPDLLDAVEAVEDDAEVTEQTWDRSVEHPADREPVLAAGIQLAADIAAIGLAATGALLPFDGPARLLRGVALLADNQPRLREQLEARLGRVRTDVVLTLATAIGSAAAESVAKLAVDAAQRGFLFVEASSSYTRWGEWEAELAGQTQSPVREPLPRRERPVDIPAGPVERVADETATGSLLGTLAFAGGTRFSDAIDALELGAPKAARASREAFAATVSTALSRAGVLTLHPGVWRRLDRLSAVVIDGEALLTDRRVVLEAEPEAEVSAAELWMIAQRALRSTERQSDSGSESRHADAVGNGARGDSADDARQPRAGRQAGPDGPDQEPGQADSDQEARREGSEQQVTQAGSGEEPPRLVHPGSGTPDRGMTRRPVWREVRRGERVLGRVLIGREMDRRAQALLESARAAGVRVILSAHQDLRELRSLADEFVPGEVSTSKLVDDLQRDGQVVAVLGARSFKALDWADVSIGLARGENGELRVPWSADAVCRDLAQVQRILAVVPAARQVSERARVLALSATALGGLMLAVTPRGGPSAPLLAANVAGLLNGAVTGWRVARGAPVGPVAPLLPWHALGGDEVLDRLPAPPAIEERSEEESPSHTGLLKPFASVADFAGHMRRELSDPLTPLLGVGALATAILGSPSDAVLLSSVLTVNAMVSARQRQRAERALHSLMEREQTIGRLIAREDRDRLDPDETVVPASLLEVGDLIALHAGDVIPADGRLLRANELEVDESGLTGESVTVDKQTAATPGAVLGDRACMVFEGSTVVNGDGLAVVVATGADTQAGRATAGARPPEKTGVQAQLRELTDRALPLTLAGGSVVTLLGGLRGRVLRQAIADGVAVAVAAVPEGLPLVATVAQLAAARRLSRYGVLVRASRTVEALGRVDTVCFDKTGTLTHGKLRLAALADMERQFEADADSADARRLLRAAARACPDPHDGPVHHATDRAVLDAAHEILGTDSHPWDPIEEVPFESNRGYAAALGKTRHRVRLFAKGAPEIVLPHCTGFRTSDGKTSPLDEQERERAKRAVLALAEQGLRVLVVARREFSTAPEDVETAFGDLTLLGLLGLADTPRPHSVALVNALQDNDIRVCMITGDHPVTAAAVARQLGIPADGVTTGADLDRLDESGQTELIERSAVFARVNPEHKVRIVSALRRRGHTVAMTGDGSNDAAAIRTADVGIGMAAQGSVAARNAADLVLTRTEPLALLDALVEGRGMWRRVTDAVGVLVGGNAGEVGFTLYGTAVGGQAPIGTRQFLLVNMLTDMFPALALALSRSGSGPADDPDVDEETRARHRAQELAEIPRANLGADLPRALAVRGIATGTAASVAWTIGRYTGTQRRAATIGLVALISTQLGQTLLAARTSPLIWLTTVASGTVLGAVVMTPGLCTYFGCRPLGPVGWTIALGSAATASALTLVRIPSTRDDRPDPRSAEAELAAD
ncbi:cation-translocating P-type ATPase [Nocardia sp. CDC160]|uniref:cation-translocating P-type ATPase n=1 Tax=Nocardia sp. CDC160 TaxID=3112166 RepID=UPI002DB9852B|nr:cation-translocating P-type ATPase [Nocardia sp. CDC160]MEC3919021.1 cation-translocating P-type ATPase [Nocardia sp. CDC160]